MSLLHYLAGLSVSRQLLWCYLLWYLCMAGFHFDPQPTLWLNSAGLALLVGLALFISTGPCHLARIRARFWETLRLFACPFLVSSFTAMTQGKGFFLLLSSAPEENLVAATGCAVFLALVAVITRRMHPHLSSSHYRDTLAGQTDADHRSD